MAEWISAILSVKSERNLSRVLMGGLAEGIVIHRLNSIDEFWINESDRSSLGATKLILSIRKDLLDHPTGARAKREYDNIRFKVVVFLRVFCNPGVYTVKIPNITEATFLYETVNPKPQKYAYWWNTFLQYFEQNTMALRLFDQATYMELGHPMIRIMYTTIALESILLRNEKTELSYKFRIRGAFILGHSEKTRAKYYSMLKLAYDIRSAVVHSNDLERRKLRKRLHLLHGMNATEFNDQLIRIAIMLIKGNVKKPAYFLEIDQHMLKDRD